VFFLTLNIRFGPGARRQARIYQTAEVTRYEQWQARLL
jgi:hypothetical protein